jgi:hypothetical protein
MRTSRWLVLTAGIAILTTLVPAEALAQQRAVPRSAGRHVVASRPYYRSSYYRPYYGYYRPYYSRPYYSYYPYYRPYYGYGFGFGVAFNWYGWYPYGYYGYPYPYPYPYAYGPYAYLGEARIQVQPRHAQVFIDGYFVGTVDEFDGWAQRLRVEPGERELEIYLDGYRTYRQKVLFRPTGTLRIEHVLQPLAAGEAPEARPTPSQAPSQPPARRVDPGPPPRRDAPYPPPRAGETQNYGAIAVRVQPADAEVLVNGERWESPEAGDLTLQLSEGTHRVEIRRDGYRTYGADIRVRRGETTTLNVSLSRN